MNQVALIADEQKELLAIEFSVAGAPIPQGSKSVSMRGGRPVLMDQQDMKTKTQPAGRLKRWRARIAAAASCVMPGELWAGHIELVCEFVMPRSPSHYTGTGKLTKGAPMNPRKDVDKLLRAVGDALTDVVYVDDNQVRKLVGTKRFANKLDAIGGVIVKVRQVNGEKWL